MVDLIVPIAETDLYEAFYFHKERAYTLLCFHKIPQRYMPLLSQQMQVFLFIVLLNG